MNSYHILRPDGTEEGPVEESALRALVGLSHYPSGTMAWCEGMTEWQLLEDIAALSPAPPPAVPQPPAPEVALPASAPPSAACVWLRQHRRLLVKLAVGLSLLLLLVLVLCNIFGSSIASDEDARDFYDDKIEELRENGDERWKILKRNRPDFRSSLRGETRKEQELVLTFFAAFNSRDGIDYYMEERNFHASPSVLRSAVNCGHLDMLRYLMEEKGIEADDELLISCAYCKPRGEDARSGRDILRYLVEEAGLKPNGETLRFAGADYDCLRYLVEKCGLRPDEETLKWASWRASAKVVRYLVKRGLEPHAAMLREAVVGGNLSVVKYYLKDWGMKLTPSMLTTAATRGDLELVRFMVEEQGIKPEKDIYDHMLMLRRMEDEKQAVVEVARYFVSRFPDLDRPSRVCLDTCDNAELVSLLSVL